MSDSLSDLRSTLRTLARNPGFASMAVLTLALGIGGATTMYGFLQGVARFGEPTLPEPECVARLFATAPGREEREGVRLREYQRWAETAPAFESLAAYAQRAAVLRSPDGDAKIQVLGVTPSYLELLKTPPLIGRLFKGVEGEERAALLSERAWRSRFGADPGAIGRRLSIEEESYTIVGVISERLGLVMPRTDLFVPLDEDEVSATVMVIGRRRSNQTWEQVRAQMQTTGFSEDLRDRRVWVRPILEDAGFRTRALWLLAVGPALVVLLIGCGNLASLLLVRAVRREREIAVRLALGAPRRRLAAELLLEGWAIAVAAGALGVVLAWLGLSGMRSVLPGSFDIGLSLNARTLLFAGFATLATPLVFAAAPLLHSSRLDVSDALSGSLHRPLLGVGRYQLRDVFAILEVGSSIALVAFALMLLSLFEAARSLELGFESAGLVVAQVSAPGASQANDEASLGDITRRLTERISALPAVSRVTTGDLPHAGSAVRVGSNPGSTRTSSRQVRVGAGYFETLRLPIVRGHAFDDPDAMPADAVVVSARLASHLWPDTPPLGQALYVDSQSRPEVLTVVGVAADAVRLGRFADTKLRLGPRYAMYRPWSAAGGPDLHVIVRVRGQQEPSFDSIREAVSSTDRRLRLEGVSAMGTTINAIGQEEGAPVLIYLLGGFGGLALVLAAIGVFGVMSQLVDERRIELGTRLALGASPAQLERLVIHDGLLRVGIGATLGLAVLAATARAGFGGLMTVSSADPWLWLGLVLVLAFVAAAACYLPAWRAARVDPMVALRSE